MHLKVLYKLGLIVAVTTLFWTCSTDFELNAKYKSTTIIYGLLDPTVDTQFVKINKSFMGDGNNYDYAAINDCTMYSSLSAKVQEIVNGQAIQEYDLKPIWVKGIEDGLFYGDSQKVYYFVNNSWNYDATYRLVVDLEDGSEKVTAETRLVESFGFNSLFSQILVGGVGFANNSSSENNNYPTLKPEWRTPKNGKRFELSLKFYYTEHMATSQSLKFVEWNLGSLVAVNTIGGQEMSTSIAGSAFFSMLKNKLKNNPNESNVEKRVPYGVHFYVTATTEDMHTYMEVNEPSNGVVTERPSFTNVNNGLGIFSSRIKIGLTKVGFNRISLNKFSTKELCIGQYTGGMSGSTDLKFCTDSSAWAGESYSCQ